MLQRLPTALTDVFRCITSKSLTGNSPETLPNEIHQIIYSLS